MAYILDKDVPEGFDFEVGGHTYTFKYPTTEEVELIAKQKDETKNLDIIYGFISSKDESAPNIKEVMAKVNTKVLANFVNMIKTELGVSE